MKIATEAFRFGSIQRKTYRRYVKRYLYRYRGVSADLVNGNEFIVDELMEELHAHGAVSKSDLERYNHALAEMLHALPQMEGETDEEIYREVLRIRETYRTAVADRYLQSKKEALNSKNWQPIQGIDQSQVFWQAAKGMKFATLMLMDAEMLQPCLDTYSQLTEMGIRARILIQKQGSLDTCVTEEDSLCGLVESDDLIMMDGEHFGFPLHQIELRSIDELVVGFGEWFVGVFRKLSVNAYLVCRSQEILTRAVTNSIDKEEMHWIYVPAGFDLIESIPVVERAVVNYRVLSWISAENGLDIYRIPILELMNRFPSYFLHSSSDLNCSLPFQVDPVESEEDFLGNKTKSVFDWVHGQMPDVELGARTIPDRNGDPMKVTFAKLARLQDHKTQVVSTEKAQEIRSFFRESEIDHGLAMNFLFFATDKSIATYNQMRKDRPLEQVDRSGWHIDYRKNEAGETFPLYAKAAVGADEAGELYFFRKRLGAGVIWLNDQRIVWREDQVDPIEPRDFCIFTPYSVKMDTEEYLSTREVVGEGRVNLVVVDDRIVSIRKGGVILPNIGVVLSMEERNWRQRFPHEIFDEQGYGCADAFHFTLSLERAAAYRWVYGGAMFLIHQGEAFDTEEKLMAEFRKEGWLSDLSKQTQDSETFRLEKHPRSMMGRTRSGEFFMVVCSGRSKHSVGADYLDLIQIAKTLFDDVEMLVNVDGGASSFMGLIHRGEVLELSDVTFTNDSSAGTLRPLNSIFTITYTK